MAGATVEYRDIKGFPGYRVGSDGSVWSQRWKDLSKHNWHRLALSRRRKQGYVTACFRAGSKNYIRYVHRLVLEAFVGPCPEGMECRHLNRDRGDNRLENLAWGTHEQNLADRIRHGTYGVKLTARDVTAIISLVDDGICPVIIARAFGVQFQAIQKIARGEAWKHLSCDS